MQEQLGGKRVAEKADDISACAPARGRVNRRHHDEGRQQIRNAQGEVGIDEVEQRGGKAAENIIQTVHGGCNDSASREFSKSRLSALMNG